MGFAPLNPEFVEYTNRLHTPAGTLAVENGDHATGYIPSPVDMSHLRHMPENLRQLSSATDLPAQYDLRSILGKLPPVRDQRPFNTCWTFAFCASAESCLRPGMITDFSEWHMAHSSGFDRGWNNLGNFFMALAYCTAWKGLVNESACPYNYQYPETGPNLDLSSIAASWHVREVNLLPSTTSDNPDVKQEIMRHGAVSVDVNYYAEGLQNYTYNGHVTTTLSTPSAIVNHGVAIVGWDDAFPSSAFINRPATNGAWIVRNSGSENLNDAGYFYLSYFDPSLKIRGCVSDVRAVEDDFDVLWSYSPFGLCPPLGSYTNWIWGANIFTSYIEHNLSGVGFYLMEQGSRYEVRVYTGCAEGNPTSGTCQYGPQGAKGPSLTGTRTYAGYYTVELPSAVMVPAGQKFSIVILFTTPEYTYPLAVEYAVSGYSSNATAAPGQSYWSDDGVQWMDMTSFEATANVCIDAFSTFPTLQPPTNVSASDDTYTDRVRVSWKETVKAESYSVYRINSSGSFSNAVRLGTVLDSPYDDMSAMEGVTYSYWVTAARGAEEGQPGTPDTGRREYAGFNSLVTALDTAGLTWTTGGNANWYGQTATYYFGGRAARSGTIGNSQTTWLQTTVTGPGVFSWYWKVSSELGIWTALYDYDYLRFYYDGVEQTKIAGEKNWAWKGYSIPAGAHTLKWAYTKDASTASGSDCGWVDKVVWEPEVKLADLVLKGVYVDSSLWTAGEEITVAVTEENQGAGSARAHRAQLYLSTDAAITSDDLPLGSPISYKKVNASNTVSRQVSFLAPDRPRGSYYLGSRLDIDGLVGETSKANNIGIRGENITYDPVVTLPSDRGSLSPTDAKLFTDWIVEHAGWTTDYASVPMADFSWGYLLNERPAGGATGQTTFKISRFTVSAAEIVVGVDLSIASIPKQGAINGCMVIDGRQSLAADWSVVSYRPLSDGKISFADGRVTLTFARPEGYSFFRARIQKDEPSGGVSSRLQLR